MECNTNLLESLDFLSGGKALDMGCGVGDDSIFLAKYGYEVTSLDISKMAIHDLNVRCLAENLNLNSIVGDIIKYKINETFDLIVCNNVLHFLSEKDSISTLRRIKGTTKKGGINIISLRGILDLRKVYLDWEILSYRKDDWEEIVARRIF